MASAPKCWCSSAPLVSLSERAMRNGKRAEQPPCSPNNSSHTTVAMVAERSRGRPATSFRPPRGRVGSGPADVCAKKCGFRTFWHNLALIWSPWGRKSVEWDAEEPPEGRCPLRRVSRDGSAALFSKEGLDVVGIGGPELGENPKCFLPAGYCLVQTLAALQGKAKELQRLRFAPAAP
jgi:hypothetical protein